MSEEGKEEWAVQMKKYLLKMNKKVEERELTEEEREEAEIEFRRIILEGARYHLKRKGKTGLNLLKRLVTKADEVLAFIKDPKVPFTNNEAERHTNDQGEAKNSRGLSKRERRGYFLPSEELYLRKTKPTKKSLNLAHAASFAIPSIEYPEVNM